MNASPSIALLHGAGYAGREVIRWLSQHPHFNLTTVTSRTYAGQAVAAIYPELNGITSLVYSDPNEFDSTSVNGVLIAAEHGRSASLSQDLIKKGFDGVIVDLSADFRLGNPELYETWYNFEHPAPELLQAFHYGLVEVQAPYASNCRYIANPGCFASAIALALYPITRQLPAARISVTALTGASGSGARAKPTTHFPDRDGNVRAYKVLRHQHLPEIRQTIGVDCDLAFVPVSGPWTRGIWGTAQLKLPVGITEIDVEGWFTEAYEMKSLIRCFPGRLPEQRHVAHTPFCDIGWVQDETNLVVGFSIDNLLKGAATQAIQNLNLLFGLPDALGLLPAQMLSSSTV